MIRAIKPNTTKPAIVPEKLLRKEAALGTTDCSITAFDIGGMLLGVGGGIAQAFCAVDGVTLDGTIAGIRRLFFTAVSLLKVLIAL